MKIIQVTYETQVANIVTDQQIQEWLEYVLTERGDISGNPYEGRGPEPNDGTIAFTSKTVEQAAQQGAAPRHPGAGLKSE